ncbi:restriction endonuclease subunit S, partial [Campylobacter jejuni]
EQKQALINETITKGLDKNINFKDSGIEWLGEIPQHWEVKKLKMLFTLGNGLNITKADFVSYGIPCVSYGEIHSKYPCRLNTTIHTLPFVSKTYLADKPQSLLQKGDFVFVDTSEDIEGSGNFTSIQSDTPIFAGYHTIILKYKGKINSLYFSFLFDSIFTRNQIRKEVCGVKVFSITKSILKEVQCLIPPLKEQEQIANFLDEKCEKIDLLIEKTKKQIKLIKEYKTTLINQAVCGRINL